MSSAEFLAEVKQEGDTDPFAQFDKEETPSESPAENEVMPVDAGTIDPPQEEENIPFHKHPRWIERQQELEELRAFKEATEPRLSEIEQFRTQVEGQLHGEQPAIPKWFENLYGPNEEAWIEYQSHEQSLREEIRNEVIQAQVQEQQQKEHELQYWNGWVDKQVDELVKDPNINFDPKDKNLLISTILKYKPTDANNNYDFRAGYELMQLARVQNQASTAERKQARKVIADSTVKSPGSEPKKKDYKTPADLRGVSWNAL